ncbi:MAG: SxtJ family membrane protein [Gallionella sp.]|nr:SxtJ family membrane protein [Gallionella sp.]
MAHEEFNREQHIEGSSDRVFGLVFAAVFLIIAGWPLFHGEAIRWWSVGVAIAFALVALVKPALLAGLNRLWMKLGVLLGKVVSPIALGILFYVVITPLGMVIRLTGKDPLRLKFQPDEDSYWMLREPPGPPPGSMNNQF